MKIQHFFDPDTFTLTYVISDEVSKDALVIDPVLDFDPASGKLEDKSLKEVIDYIKAGSLKVKAILETHAHADHISGSQILKQIFPEATLAISEKIKVIQEVFKNYFNIDYLQTNGSQFDYLLKDNEEIEFGSIRLKAIPTPGHTPACMSFLIADNLFTGDSLFMPDYGTGRCDFPKGSAKDLFNSIKNNLYQLPDSTNVFVGHDYSPNGREMRYQTTIGESKKNNIQLKSETLENDFISFRENRDKTLKAPRLLYPSIQVNINAGLLPPAEDNQRNYLKTPLFSKLNLGKL
jgi:glyoxylase-like metal-dependent hydrolase (beta-lactamase superfamily II)